MNPLTKLAECAVGLLARLAGITAEGRHKELKAMMDEPYPEK